jgi:molybdenum cofactor cytidylyltransferase
VLRINVELLERINELEGLTLSTKYTHTLVQPKEIVATVKIIPYSLPMSYLQCAEELAAVKKTALISVDMLTPQPVSMIFSGSASMREKLNADFAPLIERVQGMGSFITATDYVELEDAEGEIQLANVLLRRCQEGAKIILLAGETAIMDRYDIIPRALERAGGRVEVIGAPVDPGNLLMLGYLERTPVLGAPGCARSKKINIIDWVLPRLLAGDYLLRSDFIRLGHGGLLEDTNQRPAPRDKVEGEMLHDESANE